MQFVTLYPILIARSHIVGLPIYMNVSDNNISYLCIVDNFNSQDLFEVSVLPCL